MMGQHCDFQEIVERLRGDADPVALMRSLVIQSGGHWTDHTQNSLFEIHFLGIVGVGTGAGAAVENWLANATNQRFEVATSSQT